MRHFLAAALTTLLVAGSAMAAPPKKSVKGATVEVVVTEIAAGHAYIKPGASAGVRRGAKVTLGNKEYTVSMATASFAIVELGEEPPKEGEKGRAVAVDEAEEPVAKLKKPRPDSAFEDVWPAPVPPSSGKAVRYVPLGDSAADSKTDMRFTVLAGGLFPAGERGGTAARAELNARVRAEPFTVPLALLLDASLQNWFGPGMSDRAGRSARPVIRARELMLAYGSQQGFSANIGRMRYAASTLGTLDGLRLRSTVGDSGFALAAFGGLLPDPLSSTPSVDAQRFGVEASYTALDAPMRPEAALVVQGSTFDGKLDERRISGIFGVFPGHARFGGHFEAGNYAADNPFGAGSVELNNAGADGSVILGPLQLGARIEMRKPERSRWLASYLPLSFFCLTAPPPPVNPGTPIPAEKCDGRTATRVEGALDASVSFANVIIAGGATTARDVAIGGLPSMFGVFANGRVMRIAQHFRADVGASYSTATYLRMLGLTGGPGVTFFEDTLDLGAYYRFSSINYDAGGDARSQHGIGASGSLVPNRQFALTLQSELIRGTDIDALLAFVTAMYRPKL